VLVGETSGRMSGFKAWNASGQLKKVAEASSLSELMRKGMCDPVVLFRV